MAKQGFARPKNKRRMTENKYTEFYDMGKGVYEVWNIIYNKKVGEIRKERMGKWMHWHLFGDSSDVGFSNGCLKEISKFITSLYSKEKKEAKEKKEDKKTEETPAQKELKNPIEENTPTPPKEKETQEQSE